MAKNTKRGTPDLRTDLQAHLERLQKMRTLIDRLQTTTAALESLAESIDEFSKDIKPERTPQK